jgi:PAS domain S-box-containing protein
MSRNIPKVFNFVFFESINNPVFVMDKRGTWLYCNKAFEVFSGLQNEAIKLQIPAIRHFLRSSAAERCTDANRLFFANNLQSQTASIQDGAGLHYEINVNKYILRNKQSCASGFIGIVRNVKELIEHYPSEKKMGGSQAPRIVKAKIVNEIALTQKELKVLNLISFGYSTKKIAALLGNSVHTIADNQKSIYLKLNAQSKVQALNAGRMRGLLKIL